MTINAKSLHEGKDFRIGYEKTHTGTDLVLWVQMKTNEAVNVSISPK